MKHLIPISGKDSLATALVQTAREPDLTYEFLFNDVGVELPETYEWLQKLESQKQWNITRISKNLEDVINSYNGFLPSQQARYCTRETKIKPMETYLKNQEVFIYYGIRYDEDRRGYVPIANSNITPVFPLKELKIDLQGVYSILNAQNLKPPTFFWRHLYDKVSFHLDALDPKWRECLQEWQFDIIFAGRSRSNCYFCFFQRVYEWLWLYETHPDLFEKSKAFEKKDYSWNAGYSLDRFDDYKERSKIFDKKVKTTIQQILKIYTQKQFNIEVSDIELFSCGLLCGK